jgi:hypothetical protein
MIYSKLLQEGGTRNSSEVLVMPCEDINTKQILITGEKFPDNVLELCDNCYWCCTCFNMKGLIDACPLCDTIASRIPITLDETSRTGYSEKSGLTLYFDRKNQFR